MNEYNSGIPNKPGRYRVWELCSGLSLEVQFDGKQWVFPSDWIEDPNYGNVVDGWCDI